MVNQPILDLGMIVNDIKGYEFSMDRFEDRLKIQKTIYLLQAFGIYLGYEFGWYLRGPYCTILADNAYFLDKIKDAMPKNEKMNFVDEDKQKLFEKFKEFMKGKEESIDDLEILASLHLLKKLGKDDEETKTKVENKQEQFTKERVGKMWEELKKWSLL